MNTPLWLRRWWNRTPGPQAPEGPPTPPEHHPSGASGLRLDAVQRGREAQRLLTNPVLIQALADLESDAIRDMVNTKTDERDKREDHYRAIRALAALRGKLDSYVAGGRIKAAQDDAA